VTCFKNEERKKKTSAYEKSDLSVSKTGKDKAGLSGIISNINGY